VVPEPLWWLLGVIVSFYFGARHQMKGQEFQKAKAISLAQASTLRGAQDQDAQSVALEDTNQALLDWQAVR
jgi:hypothetical protein